MDRLIQRYAEHLVKGLIAIVIGLVVFIFMDKTTGQEARYMQMINDNKALIERFEKENKATIERIEQKLNNIQTNTIRTRAGMRVIIKYIEKSYPPIQSEIEWAELYDLNTSNTRGAVMKKEP